MKIDNKFKIVEVSWIDAQTSTESLFLEEINQLEPIKSKSVGYLVLEKKDYIVLGFLDFGEGMMKHWQIIPTGMIKSIKELN